MARVVRRHVVLLESNAINPLMFLFGVLKKPERGTLKFTSRYLKSLGQNAGLSLRAFAEQGFVLPNKTPRFALRALSAMDGKNPLGFYLLGVFDKPAAG
jgi:hypothetical protein